MDKPGEQITTHTDNSYGKVKNILIIDDDDTTCLLIKEILSDYHVKITTAKTIRLTFFKIYLLWQLIMF